MHRKFLTVGLLGLAAAGGAFAFHYAKFAYVQCHPPRTVVSNAERLAAVSAIPTLEEVSFQARDGVSLHGWFAPPKNGIAVILVHGLGGNRASLLPEAEIFARHGYGLLLYDSRAAFPAGARVVEQQTIAMPRKNFGFRQQ